jgi:hypothetical protein
MGDGQAKTYNAETMAFRDALERIQFLSWLRKRLAPTLEPAEFASWLKSKGPPV